MEDARSATALAVEPAPDANFTDNVSTDAMSEQSDLVQPEQNDTPADAEREVILPADEQGAAKRSRRGKGKRGKPARPKLVLPETLDDVEDALAEPPADDAETPAIAVASEEAASDDEPRADEPLADVADEQGAEADVEMDACAELESDEAEDAGEPDLAKARVIEALLFASDTPLGAARLGDLAGVSTTRGVRALIDFLNQQYESAGLSFRIEEIARGFQMLTIPEYRTYVQRLNNQRSHTRLTDAVLETLSIVAYKQPIIRSEVEAIRGVACGEVLNRLREMGLVRVVGRAEIVGRPMLYGTTKKFLDVFGLADLDDLPAMESLGLRRPMKLEQPAETREAPAASSEAEAQPVRRAAVGA